VTAYTDAGKTWQHLGLDDGEQIPSLAVDPRNPNRVYAAVLGHPYGPNAERGIFRSLDGGRTWRKILYLDRDTGGSEVVLDPQDSRIVYAAMWRARQGPWEDHNAEGGTGGGLYRSTDGGDTWHKIDQGLPANLVQVNFAIAPSAPNRLYAVFSTTAHSRYESGAGMGRDRSDDGGLHWRRITTDPRPTMKIGGGDYQNIWIDPGDPNLILLVGDQGAIVSVDHGRTWSSWYNQPTAQLYHVSTDSHFPYRVCGGQQESGSVCIDSRGNDGEITFRDWHPVGAIEYGTVVPDPLHPDLVYGAGRNEVSKFHWSTGQVQNVTPIPLLGHYRAERTEPLAFSPVDPHRLYYGANVLFETRDGGRSWRTISPDLARAHPGIPASVGALANAHPRAAEQRGAIYAIAPSFFDPNTIWVGTDDGTVWLTHDDGRHWRKVTQIAASRFTADGAFVSVSRLRIDDLRPLIYRTRDGGRTWTKIVHGLPPRGPVDAVREDPVRRGLLYAGTETGVYVSFDDGDVWQPLQFNLPHSSMRDLAIHGDDLIVATHGRSFWILDDVKPLRQARAALANAWAHLYRPARAWRIRRDTNTDTPLPPDEPAGRNPPSGAIIDYTIGPRAAGAPVTLEIQHDGRTIRRYSSADPVRPSAATLADELIPPVWVARSGPLPNSPGMHRWIWDLHDAPPVTGRRSYPISAVPHATPRIPQGPLALPGRYTVRLTVGGRSETAPLTVLMDPRVHASQADLERQFRCSTRLARLLSAAAQTTRKARALDDRLKALATGASSPVAAAAALLERRVAQFRGGTDAPVAAHAHPVETLARFDADVGRADAAPTVAERAAATALTGRFTTIQREWRALAGRELAAVNAALRGAGSAPIRF
jgi:photosystem II stability/assembly factor-like uncharacterized protein